MEEVKHTIYIFKIGTNNKGDDKDENVILLKHRISENDDTEKKKKTMI